MSASVLSVMSCTFCTASAAACRSTTVNRWRSLNPPTSRSQPGVRQRPRTDDHDHSFRAPSESTGGVGEEDVQPDRRNQKVRKLPTVLRNGWLAHCRMESWVTNPAKIISGPKALSGRLRHATMPAKMNGRVTS